MTKRCSFLIFFGWNRQGQLQGIEFPADRHFSAGHTIHVPQQTRIRRPVNVAFGHRRIGPHMVKRNGLFGNNIESQDMVDPFPGFRLNRTERLVQQGEVDRRLLQQAAESLQRLAFGDPNRRLPVVESFPLHDDNRPKQVLAGENRLAASRRCRLAELLQVAMDQIEDHRVTVQNLAELLVFVTIIAYRLVIRLLVGPPKIENPFGFHTHRCPP